MAEHHHPATLLSAQRSSGTLEASGLEASRQVDGIAKPERGSPMRKLPAISLIAVLPVAPLLVATANSADSSAGSRPQSSFSRMFPALPRFVAPSNYQIAALAQTQLDPDADSGNNAAVPSGFTYFGQFIDHDLTLDTAPPPTAPVDPTTLKNGRTFRFDLDSVYGGGPSVSPQLYADGKHFKIQDPNPSGVRDLPRNPAGSAILVDPREDENEIISQLHTAFLAYHNKLIDSGLTFAKAQATVIADYQHIDWDQAAVQCACLPHHDARQVLRTAFRTGRSQGVRCPANRTCHSQARTRLRHRYAAVVLPLG
jgi:hypothetical protein